MNKEKLKFLWPLAIAIIFAFGIWVGSSLVKENTIINTQNYNTDSKVQVILNQIDKKYVDSVDYNFLMESSIEGMIKKLDPHSQYIPPKDLAHVNEQLDGRFGGVGIRFLIHDDTLVVTHVLEDSPSKSAGLKAGDRILRVDDSVLVDVELNNQLVMDLLKGVPNTKVNLLVKRNENIVPISITRGIIKVNSIDANVMLNKEVGYIKLSSFTENSGAEFITAAIELRRNGMSKLIFDLRNNGGGFLHAAKIISDQFLTKNKLIVYTEGRKTGRQDYYSSNSGELLDVELIVLINANSASASEIVAGAIQDNDRGYILGRRSFGKGLVQDQQEFSDGSALRLTISRYFTPTGRSIQKPYGEDINYENDYYDRYMSGELFSEDSIKINDSLKYTTPNGRVVYGGGGIYPDYFVPNDTIGGSYYLSSLYYGSAFNQWAFSYLDNKRTKWASMKEFNNQFRVTSTVFENFVKYTENNLGIVGVEKDISQSKSIIKNRLKAELARHLFEENGFYSIFLSQDTDVQEAIKKFNL